MTHPQVALGEIATLIRGITYKPSDVCEAITQSAVACMRTKNVQEILDESDIVWIPASLIRNSSKYLNTGDILVSSANSWNLVGKGCWVPELKYPASAGGFISILRGNPNTVDLRYLYHWFVSPQTQAKLRSYSNKTTNISNLDHSRTLATEIPLPPLEEQRRIAAILDKCHESELLATKATSLYSSLFEASFHSFLRQLEDRERIPQVPLFSVCTRITKGSTPSSLGLPDADGDIPFVRVQDIDKNVLIAESVALQIPMETHHALARSMLQSGDILVSIAGTIGRVCEVRSLPPHGANCNQAVAIAKPIPDVVRPLFLKCLLSDRPAQKQMRGAGVTGTITNLSLGQLGEIKIPVPSIEAQDRICDQLERLAKIGERFQNSFVTAKLLSDSLTSFLMSGT